MKRSILLFLLLVIICSLISIKVTGDNSKENNNENINSNSESKKYDELFNSNLTGDKWPVNEFTKRMPKPQTGELEIVAMARSRMNFNVKNITSIDYQDYIYNAKNKGFTSNASERGGYSAINEDGYLIQINYDSNSKIMSVSITY